MKRSAQTIPLLLHKNLVIQAIESDPDNVSTYCPSFDDASTAIAALRAHPGNWIVDGMLRTDEEHRAYMLETYGHVWRGEGAP